MGVWKPRMLKQSVSSSRTALLNQAVPAWGHNAWFLRIALPVNVCMSVCLCVCVSALRLLISSGVMWCDVIDPI